MMGSFLAARSSRNKIPGLSQIGRFTKTTPGPSGTPQTSLSAMSHGHPGSLTMGIEPCQEIDELLISGDCESSKITYFLSLFSAEFGPRPRLAGSYWCSPHP